MIILMIGFLLILVGGGFAFYWFRIYLPEQEWKNGLNLRYLLVSVPKETKPAETEKSQTFQEAISVFEQLLANLYAVGPKERLALEIIAKEGRICFYVVCNKDLKTLVEKQIHGFYPAAHIEEESEFRFFKTEKGFIRVAYLGLKRSFLYPIKTYLKLESDPLNALTNALSKLGEGSEAAVSVLIRPITKEWQKRVQKEARLIQEGKGFESGWRSALRDIGYALNGEKTKGEKPEEQKARPLTPIEENAVKALQEKAQKYGFESQVRIITVSPTQTEAEMNINTILAAFSQFSAPELNQFAVVKTQNLTQAVKGFILKSFDGGPRIVLNTEEIASLIHLPTRFIETPKIHWLLAKRLSPPPTLPTEGTLIGMNVYRGEVQEVRIQDDDRRRHLYAIGKTGTGKTTLFLQMAASDIKAGKGVGYIDPHGDAIEALLARIPPERINDVILFEPADLDRPMGLNLLEWKRPEEKDFLVGEWIAIFYKLFDPGRIGIIGPQWEHWGRNAALTVMEQPGGGTLLEIPRLFTDADFREKAIANVADPVVKAFWVKQMAQTADFHKSEMLNYFISKFGRFMTNYMMRNIIGQTHSAFDLREVMNQGKVLLVNLAKGKLGEINSFLLGLILVSKIQMAAMSRADLPEEQRRDFYLYVDEFQNFTTDSFISILSEARKYRLCLNVTNQYIAQLEEAIRNAVIGNAGTLITFRVGAHDAEFLVKEFEGLSETDLMNLDNYNAYIKLLINGVASKPFSLRTIKPSGEEVSSRIAEQVRTLSRLKYGRDRAEVEKEIYERAQLGEASLESSGSV